MRHLKLARRRRQRNKKLKPTLIDNLPSCSIVYDIWNGDWDCEAFHTEGCEYCLCNYEMQGGLRHPFTGKLVKESHLSKKLRKRREAVVMERG